MTEHVLSAGVWKGEGEGVFKAVLRGGNHFFYGERFAYLHTVFFKKIKSQLCQKHMRQISCIIKIKFANKQCISKININSVGKNKYMYPSYLVKTQKGTVLIEK